ncbi:hypothetical protein ACFPN0_04805 [Kitasatospora cinereorecta]
MSGTGAGRERRVAASAEQGRGDPRRDASAGPTPTAAGRGGPGNKRISRPATVRLTAPPATAAPAPITLSSPPPLPPPVPQAVTA